MKLAMTVAALAAAFLTGCGETDSGTVAVDFAVDVSEVVRPAGSGVAIVGNYFSIGATADYPEGDPVHGLKLRQQEDGTYKGSAWLPSKEDVVYVVYMSNPYAPMIAMPGGAPVENHVDFTKAQSGTGEGEHVTVTHFDVPQNITKPCVTFNVYVPANTPSGDPVYIAGNDDLLGPWLPGKQPLAASGGNYSVHLCFDQGKELQYKYVRSNGDWSKVEKNPDGSERNNRTLTVTEDVSRTDTVEKWADL
jgi:hypothetical protein